MQIAIAVYLAVVVLNMARPAMSRTNYEREKSLVPRMLVSRNLYAPKPLE